MEKHWEHFSHQADIGVRGIGASKEEAFEQAAVALIAVITDPQTVAPNERQDVTCDAPDDELLLPAARPDPLREDGDSGISVAIFLRALQDIGQH